MERKNFIKSIALSTVALSVGKSSDLLAIKNTYNSKPIIIDEIIIQKGKGTSDLRFSYGELKETTFLLVRIRSGEIVGYGEVISNNFDALVKVASTILGKDARNLDNLLPEVDTVLHAAREPLSMALYDLVSKSAGVPFNVLLGGAARTEIPVVPAMFPKDQEHAAKTVKDYVQRFGIKNIKVKMYGRFEEDLANLKAVKANLPEGGFINADANRGYKDLNELLKFLPEFEKAGLNYFEDPLDGTLDDYLQLKDKSNIKIILDVFARTNKSTTEIIRKSAGNLINLHPNHQGGISNFIMKANAARFMGMEIWNGGTGYFGVGTVAYLHLGSISGHSMPCEEVGGVYNHGFTDWIIKNPLPIKDGKIQLSEEPGLGVEIDENSIAKYLVEEKKLQL